MQVRSSESQHTSPRVIVQSRSYMLPGDPIPLARARFGSHHVYDSQRQAKMVVGITIASLHGNQPLFTGPLHLDITFYFQTPKQKKKLNGCYTEYRPDISNCLKFYEDVCTSILYRDDSQIASVTARKFYDTEPRTIFTITPLRAL